uniref:Multidrug resistance-associated protein 5 n=1 Tax=Tanacetum cinerariifolium TaxID=118510 RepID=A0A6L2JL25_TANCI|nr:multidrug resistance-associated protein 5 [Tanacetum cinerariifolium]
MEGVGIAKVEFRCVLGCDIVLDSCSSGEEGEQCGVLFTLAGNDLNLADGKGLTIISDGHKGLIEAVGSGLPEAEHRQCTRHIYANFKKKWSESPSHKTVFITPEEHAMNMDEEALRETLRQEEKDQRKNEEIMRENEEHDRAWEAYADDYKDWNDDLENVFMKHIHHIAPNQAIQTQESQAPINFTPNQDPFIANQDPFAKNQDSVAANQDPVAADLQKKRKRKGKKPVEFIPDEEVVAADEPQVTEDVQKKRKRQGNKPASD